LNYSQSTAEILLGKIPISSAGASSVPQMAKMLWLVNKILVFEDVGRRPDQPEPDFLAALVAGRKNVAAMHKNVMCRTMFAMVNYFIDSAFRDWLPGKECLVISAAAALPPWSAATMLMEQPGKRPDIPAEVLCGAHECRNSISDFSAKQLNYFRFRLSLHQKPREFR
jgi:hypothetical protein